MPVLDTIIATTRATLPALQAREAELERAAARAPVPPSFLHALRRPTVALIAEVKRRSPSAGAINAGLDPATLAQAYAGGGAAAISVLTDGPFFGGALADLEAVTRSVVVPALRKDFILDRCQLLEARAAGASAVLLIVRVLDDATLRTLHRAADDLGLGVLVETHTAEEITRAIDAGAEVIGVNARDLDDFSIHREAAWQLLAGVPAGLVAVAESGMASPEDVAVAAMAGADAVLIGGALAAHGTPEAAARGMAGVPRRGR
ncbi:MAG: indole-3-glycerol phosphate synthase TrpC [Gemmatimonadales bacterium]